MANPDNDPQPADDPLTEATLQAKLTEYREALEQEFASAIAKDNSPENVEIATRDFFKENSAQAAAQIAWLMMHADSETVRLNASKYVLERGIMDGRTDGDPIKDLLNQLTATPNTKTTASPNSKVRTTREE